MQLTTNHKYKMVTVDAFGRVKKYRKNKREIGRERWAETDRDCEMPSIQFSILEYICLALLSTHHHQIINVADKCNAPNRNYVQACTEKEEC